eukprot:5104053-Ditylum_brightwellii.AAC.1
MLAARHKIFGAALDYDPSTDSYQVAPATLSYEFLDALKAQGSNSKRSWQYRDGIQSFMEDVNEKIRDFVYKACDPPTFSAALLVTLLKTCNFKTTLLSDSKATLQQE